MTSVGRPLPRNQVETREGEIYLKTPQQTIGYVNEGDILNEQPDVYWRTAGSARATSAAWTSRASCTLRAALGTSSS